MLLSVDTRRILISHMVLVSHIELLLDVLTALSRFVGRMPRRLSSRDPPPDAIFDSVSFGTGLIAGIISHIALDMLYMKGRR